MRLEGFTEESVIFFTVLCRKLKKHENTVLDYKKGSKLKSDKWNMSATQTLWVVSFVTFVIRWTEHTSRGGGAKTPHFCPPQHEKCQFETVCLSTFNKNKRHHGGVFFCRGGVQAVLKNDQYLRLYESKSLRSL